MTTYNKFLSSGMLAAVLASAGFGATPASAGVLFRPFFFDHERACYVGHRHWGWHEVCRPAGYAVNYCWHTRGPYTPVVCD